MTPLMPAPHPGGSTEGEGGSRHCELYRTLYNYSMSEHKPLNFRGSALADLRAFPATVRQEVGYQLDKVQRAGARAERLEANGHRAWAKACGKFASETLTGHSG